MRNGASAAVRRAGRRLCTNSSRYSFAPAVSYGTGTGSVPLSVAVGNLNNNPNTGDSRPDLAVANGAVSILLNDGTWPGPSPPPGGGGRFPGPVPRTPTPLPSLLVSAEALLCVDSSAPPTAPPRGAALPDRKP